jgi:putative oxygen-independent coproporphyrinogen III oxidase
VTRATAADVAHLYVHVPFCPTICPFCSFHVVRRRDDLVEAYLRRLDGDAAEARRRHPSMGPLDTVYLGGGTPTHLSDGELARLLGSIRRRFAVSPGAEITLEAHPVHVTPTRAATWRDLGFTRVSLGLQSTQDPVLTRLGRRHDAATGLAALDTLLAVDGWTVNADLITAVAGQDVAADLHAVAARGVPHLSAYTLTIEPGTPFARRGVEVPERREADALRLAAAILPAYGLLRYEVSNHAHPEHRCRHNQAYWDGRCWLGLGPSATGQEPPPPDAPPGHRLVRRRHAALTEWLDGAPADVEVLTADDVIHDGLLTGLRRVDGVDLAALARRAGDGRDLPRDLARPLGQLRRRGLVEIDGPRVAATAEGVLVLDVVLRELW